MQEEIFELTTADSAYVEPINRLLTQLSSSPVRFTIEELKIIVDSPASALFLLRCGEEIMGMLTLCNYFAPTGRKFWIEDVVVDAAARGNSYGRRLVEYALDYAEKKSNGTVLLTSKLARVAANALYRSVGFQPKETNLYRMPLPRKKD